MQTSLAASGCIQIQWLPGVLPFKKQWHIAVRNTQGKDDLGFGEWLVELALLGRCVMDSACMLRWAAIKVVKYWKIKGIFFSFWHFFEGKLSLSIELSEYL